MVRALDLRLKRSRVPITAVPLLCNNLGQVVYTYVPLSQSSIIWYWSVGGDSLRLGRSGVALAMRQGLHWFIYFRAHGPRNGDEH